MRPRKELIDIFSAFMQFDGDRFSRWSCDARLRRNMQQRLDSQGQLPEDLAIAPESFWALYWHQHWAQSDDQPSSLVCGHLSAYLQESCYWAAFRTVQRLSSTRYSLFDCFQIGIAKIDAVLKRFKSNRGASLKAFANLVFRSLIEEELRQRKEADFTSDFGLLRRVSKKRLTEALRQAGLSSTAIAQYQLAWTCYNALYVPSSTRNRVLPNLDTDLWIKIGQLYNTERLTQGGGALPEGSPALLEQWLKQCGRWVRVYWYPPVDSLNVPKPGLEAGGEVQDDLTNPLQAESLMAALMQQEGDEERQTQKTQLQAAIATAISRLDEELQMMLKLYYQDGRTQTQIGKMLNIPSQTTVTRRLQKARKLLVQAIAEWSVATLHISLTPDRIETMSADLEEWLTVHYGGLNTDSGSDLSVQEENA